MSEETTETATRPRTDAREGSKAPAEGASPPSEDWATRYKYLLADFDNFRRRVERDREAISRQARAGLVRELLPIIEGFRVAHDALAHLPASDPTRKGFELLDREWTTFLKHEGVEPVATPGRPFGAEEAEAVGEVPADGEHPDGTVVEVVQQGYRFFGGLLRPAKVIVARTPAEEHEESADDPRPTE